MALIKKWKKSNASTAEARSVSWRSPLALLLSVFKKNKNKDEDLSLDSPFLHTASCCFEPYLNYYVEAEEKCVLL